MCKGKDQSYYSCSVENELKLAQSWYDPPAFLIVQSLLKPGWDQGLHQFCCSVGHIKALQMLVIHN